MPITYTIKPEKSNLGRASRTQETGGENVRGQRSDLGFRVPSCVLIGVLGFGDSGFKVYGLGL